MARVKIKVYSQTNLDSLQNVKNKLIMHDQANGMMIFKNPKLIKEEETYGRKKNKTRVIEYLEVEVLGYNRNGKFVGSFDENTVSRIVLMYDLYKMRRLYLDHIEALEAMQAQETALNNPLQTLANATLSPDVQKEIDRCIKEDRPLLAMKLYKVETGCTLEEAKEYIKSLTF